MLRPYNIIKPQSGIEQREQPACPRSSVPDQAELFMADQLIEIKSELIHAAH